MRVRRIVAGAVLTLASVVTVTTAPHAGAAATPAPAAPENAAPVVTDDAVTVTRYIYAADVEVLANDSDDSYLQICRLEAPDDAGLGVHIWSHHGFFNDSPQPSGSTYLILEPEGELAVGSLEVTYYACDREWLTPGTLTVNVVRVGVKRVAGHPGQVRFSNPLDYAIDVLWFTPGKKGNRGVILEPHQVKVRNVHADKIAWYAFEAHPQGDGDDPLPIDGGRLRHIGGRGTATHDGRLGARQQREWENRFAQRPRHDNPRAATVQRDDSVDPPEDAAPVTAPDHARLDYYDGKAMEVLANDSDDSPADLAVCWVDVPEADHGISALIEPWWANSDRARSDDPHRYIDLGANAAEPGTYTLTYYACDKHRMTPGTLTVTIRNFPQVKVRRVPGRPGTLTFVNRGYRTVRITYFESSKYSEKTHLDVKKHSRGRLHVAYDDLTYFSDTKIGPLGGGRVKNLYP